MDRLSSMLWDGCQIRPIHEKGVGTLLPERPEGCFAQKSPDPFFVNRRQEIAANEKVVNYSERDYGVNMEYLLA
jgi:hypothetical protein